MSNIDRVASIRSDRELDKQGPTAEFGTEERKKLEKKLFIDRNNAGYDVSRLPVSLVFLTVSDGAARLKDFEEDLKLQGQEFATLLSILYVGNMLLNKIGKPLIYLPVCMATWGIARNFVVALLTRFFLGFVEAAFYPGALFLLSKWYKKDEIGLRTAMLTCGSIISNGFGALIASGILKGMEGKLGDRAWRWLFYIEGALTVFSALVAAVVLPNFPATTRSLSPIEQRLAIRRMEEDAGVGDQEETEDSQGGMIHGLVLAVTDWKMWALALGLTSQVIALSFNAYFPTLTATLGYSKTITLLLCAPPWVLTALVAFFWARHSDKTQERAFHIVIPFFIGIVGFVIAISTQALAARYVSLFLMALGIVGFACEYAWIPSCFPRPPSKRAISIAFINAFSQLGNVAGSYIWDKSWGPSYARSYGICIATSGFAIIVVLFFRWHLARLNSKMEEKEQQQSGDEKGVGRSGFRYVL
ncbi:MFS general substrate transporter [Dendrothele bispora CBS 962.96]|uniref:MFS general substrate transporter n=1 Tax=Dendrothele bispora (strain CBS 962.96) TaxID=1314807 RepID=A0A4S8KNF0_DENBC|nr:MFS general substrate transporter [Dendrothele bispora CBS 962.96]